LAFLNAIEAMESVEAAMSKSHQMIQDLFQRFLDYTQQLESAGLSATAPIVSQPPVVPKKPTKKVPRRRKVDPEKEEKIKILTRLIMTKGKIKIDDAKEAIKVEEAKYVRPLLEKIMEQGWAKKEGKTKATRYIWTGVRPSWMPEAIVYATTECPVCGTTMKKRGNWYRCPKKGCAGKRYDEEKGRTLQRGTLVPAESEAEIIARVLNQTAEMPDMEYSVDDLKSLLKIKLGMAELTKLLKQQPELEIDDGSVTRLPDTYLACSENEEINRISFATRSDGSQPARRGWHKLTRKAQEAFDKLFEQTCLHGPIKDGQKFKRLSGDVWEFKSNQHKRRITCYFSPDGVLYLLHVFKKKEDKTPKSEVNKAQTIMAEHKARRTVRTRRNPWGRRWRRMERNPNGAERELNFLEDEYPHQSFYDQRRDLIKINALREQLGLPQVDDRLRPIVEEAEEELLITEEPTIEVTPVDRHKEAREIYEAHLQKIADLQPHIDYGNYIAREVTRGRSMTPVMPLAIGGTGGGPILCDHCSKAIPLEGGAYNGVTADVAWSRHPDPPEDWVSYILGGLITMHAINGTIRFYHGYPGRPQGCYEQAMAEEDAAIEAFNASRADRSHEYRILREFFADEFHDMSDEERSALLVRVVNTLYGFDPGIGVNRPG